MVVRAESMFHVEHKEELDEVFHVEHSENEELIHPYFDMVSHFVPCDSTECNDYQCEMAE